MDSPNVRKRVRRHQTLSSVDRCSSILMRISKSNPYVGTFRHSPPTCMHWEWKAATKECPRKIAKSSLDLYKRSPYVGSKRHAPCSSRSFMPSTMLEAELCRILLEQSMLPRKMNGMPVLKDLLCSHLRGGGTQDILFDWPFGYHDMNPYPASSRTIQVLSKLACWLLLPFQVAPVLQSSSSSSVLTIGSDLDDIDRSQSSYDDEYMRMIENDSSSVEELDSSLTQVLSSQAEAYYAHQAVIKQVNDLLSEPNLDQVITQMDILRMMRNASRHLAVDSIAQLPVYTYKSKESDRPHLQDEESWCLLQNESIGNGNEILIVPPQRESEYCVICLDAFENGDRLRLLPCNHSFHDGCISKWLSGSHSFNDCYTSGCPTCRKRPDMEIVCQTVNEDNTDGVVPSWAFSKIGDALARNL